jgi:hypothetical protein
VLMASLVMWRRFETHGVAKRFVAGGSGASWAFGTHFGGVLLGLAVYVVVLEVLAAILGLGKGLWQGLPLSLVTWWPCWVFRGEWGTGERAGGW